MDTNSCFLQTTKPKKKKKTTPAVAGNATFAAATGQPAPASATTTATDTQIITEPQHRAGYSAPRVEELDDSE